MLHLLALLLNPALAQEAAPAEAPPAVEAPASRDVYEDALLVADQLLAEGAFDEARAILNWLMQPERPEFVRDEARRRLSKLPKAGDAGARMRLLPWQTVAGAWLLGPNMMWINETRGNFNEKPLLVFTGALAGGAGGAAASLLYKREEGLTHGDVSTIIHTQQLAMGHGMYLTLLHPEGEYWEYGGWGLLAGGVVGTAGGYALAELPLHEGGVAAARTGSALAPGLTLLTILAADDEYEFWQGEPRHDVAPFLVAADVGTLAGYGLGQTLDLRRVDAQMIFLGAVAGTAVGGGLAAATQDMVLWSERGVFITMEVFAIGGGALGYVLAQGIERPLPNMTAGALLSGTDEHPVLALPIPSISPTKDGWSAHVNLVDLRF